MSINGTSYDLSADRSWLVGTVTSVGTSAPLTGGTITGSGTIGITQASGSTDGYLSSTDWTTFNNKQNALTNPVTGTGTIYYLPMWSGASSLTDSILSYSLNIVTFNYNSASGGTINYTNINGTPYTYTIQMNNATAPRQTYHSYTDGNILQQINSVVVSKNLQSGQLVLPLYTATSSFTGTAVGLLGFDSLGNILTTAATTDSNIYNTDGTLTSARTLTSGGYNLTFTGSNTAATAIARGLYLTPTLIAAANSDVLVGLDVAPTFTLGAFTGTSSYAARFQDDLLVSKGQNATTSITVSNTTAGTVSSAAFISISVNGTMSMGKVSSTYTPAGTIIQVNDAVIYNNTNGDISIYNNVGTGRIKFASNASTTPQMVLSETGNLLVGTTTDSIYKFDLTGTARITSSITAGSFVKSSGTSAQILAADGSVITAGTNITISAGTISSTNSGGTVTSVAALTLGTTGTDLSSTVATGTTTPVITLQVPTASATNRGALSSANWTTFNNKESALTFSSPLSRATNTISIPAATTSVNGYLSSTDWNTFNGKQNAITLTTTGTSGAATLVGATLNIPQYQAAGTYVTSVTGTSPIVSSGGTTPAISIPAATTSVNGYLTSADWTTFNNKFTLPSLTSGSVLFSNGTTIAQDNANFFWDDTNNRLGIGTTTPSYKLDVNGTGRFQDDLLVSKGQNANTSITVSNTTAGTISSASFISTSVNGSMLMGKVSSTYTPAGTIIQVNDAVISNNTNGDISIYNNVGTGRIKFASNSSTTPQMVLSETGNLLVGTTTDSTYKFDLVGSQRITTTSTTLASLSLTNTSSVVNASTYGITSDTTVNVSAAASYTGSVVQTGVQGSLTLNFAGAATVSNANPLAGVIAIGTTNITTGTVTVTQGSAPNIIRAVSSIYAQLQFASPSTGTLSHYANIWCASPNGATGSLTVTNYYGILLQSTAASTNGITATTSWGVYQEGTADNNYLAGSLLVGTTTNSGYKLDVVGTARVSSSFTANSLIVTAATTGSVVFAAASGAISQDNANFFWDNTNKRLGIGTATPANPLQVNGAIRATSLLASTSATIGGTSAANAAAVIDIISTTKGVLFPRMTTTQKNAIATPLAGLVVYDTTLNKLSVYTTAWQTITSV